MSSDVPAGDRLITPAVRLLERDLRRKGHLTDGEHIVDWCDGHFVGLYEAGEVSTDRPRVLIPRAKPVLLAAYSDRWILFMGRKFSRSCALQAVIRADFYDERVQVLFSPADGSRFSMIEFMPAGTGRQAVERFVTDLIYRRDIATAGIPDLERHMEAVRKIRAMPAGDLLDKLVLAPWS